MLNNKLCQNVIWTSTKKLYSSNVQEKNWIKLVDVYDCNMQKYFMIKILYWFQNISNFNLMGCLI